MKNKELVLEKIERLQNSHKTLEYFLKVGNLQEAVKTLDLIKQYTESVLEQISYQQNN